MKLKCNACGQGEQFRARQAVRGEIDVYVDGDNNFIGNTTECGCADVEGCDFDDPEGPYQCAACDSEDVEVID